MTVGVDLDFQRYIERKKGARDAQTREGAAYAYGGDLRYRGTLDSLRPVRMAVEAAVRLWKSSARAELLAGAKLASPEHHGKVDALIEQAAKALHIERPQVFVSARPLPEPGAYTLGTDEDACVVIDAALVKRLSAPELLFVIGRECGHLQNDHVVYATAVYYLSHAANRFLKWIVAPATLALSAWSRRAEVSCDRAGLICTRDLGVAEAALLKTAAAGDVSAILDEMQKPAAERDGKLDELLAAQPAAQRRILALRAFAGSLYYKALVGEPGGLTQAEVDGQVGEVLAR